MNSRSQGIAGSPGSDVEELMLLYSQRGIDEWSSVHGALKFNALKFLSAAGIAQNERQAQSVILGGGKCGRFIPMPKNASGFERSFFLPIGADGVLQSIMLFVIVNGAREECLCFRFECSRDDSRHGYSHVQLVSSFKDETDDTIRGVPGWLPTSYPAFPLPAGDSIELFLSVATAMHGYRNGVDTLIRDVYGKYRPQSKNGRRHIRRLRNMLRVLA